MVISCDYASAREGTLQRLSVGFCTSLILMISAASATAQNAPATATAQTAQCFEVYRSTASGPNGAILLNKCTGQAWMLVSTSIGAGTTSRWYPISVEKTESVLPR
jgi:hypothetical protein